MVHETRQADVRVASPTVAACADGTHASHEPLPEAPESRWDFSGCGRRVRDGVIHAPEDVEVALLTHRTSVQRSGIDLPTARACRVSLYRVI